MEKTTTYRYLHLKPGDIAILNLHVQYPGRFCVILPDAWVKQYTQKGNRQVELVWNGDKIEITPVKALI